MNIREASAADSLIIQRIFKASSYPVPELQLDEVHIKKMFDRGYIVFIAEDDGNAVGCAILNATTGELHAVGIMSNQHEKDISSALIEKVMVKAKELSIEEVFVYCHSRDQKAMELYNSNGFMRKSLVPGYYSTGEPAIVFTRRV